MDTKGDGVEVKCRASDENTTGDSDHMQSFDNALQNSKSYVMIGHTRKCRQWTQHKKFCTSSRHCTKICVKRA